MSDTFPVIPDPERIAQLIAHRACCGTEHDPTNGKLHGCCVVCGVPWPCDYAGKPPAIAPAEPPAPEAIATEFWREGFVRWNARLGIELNDPNAAFDAVTTYARELARKART